MTEENKESPIPSDKASVPPAYHEKMPDTWFWIRDSKGYGSVTVTFVTIAFWVVTLVYIASMFETIGPVTMRAFDAGAASVYWIPLLSLYFGRKFTEAKYGFADSKKS